MSKEIKILALIVLVVAIVAVLGANYYRKAMESAPVIVNKNNNSGKKSSISPETLVRPDSATLGVPDAPVTLVEFLDPECEACAAFSPVVKKILKDYDPKVRLVVRYMPLHPNSLRAATLTEAAGEQGKYWEMQELLFKRHAEWGERHGAPPTAQPQNIDTLFEKYAMELGLDVEKVNDAIRENRYQAKLERDRRDGQTLGVRKTPSFFVNGRMLMRFGEYDLRALIEDELKK
ncbi:MAG: DsbA family protein [Acidobacteria bacterium]|nr:DsbA family protein [Acidobacteriota bacterium]MCA1636924.1 DsbA family protein [Acidobacteriota bacterium]